MAIKHKLVSIIMLTCVAALLLAGGVAVTSIEGEGSTFSLVLPVGVGTSKDGFLDRHNLAEATAEGRNQGPNSSPYGQRDEGRR